MTAVGVSRRQLLLGLATMCAGMALVDGCRSIGSPATTDQSTPSATAAPAQARSGGSLVVAQPAAIMNADPFPGNTATNMFRWAVFNTLVGLDANNQPVPMLAESWSFSDDRRTLTFKLRSGVKFHSGRPLRAEDARWNFEHALDPKNQSAVGGQLTQVGLRVKDALTLELTLPDAFPQIFSLLTTVPIADPQSDLVQSAAGTGAFRLDGLKPGEEMHLVRNAEYWRADRPYLDSISIQTVPDPSSAVVYLESGAAGIAPCRPGDVKRLKQGDNTSAVVFTGAGSYEILISTVDEPFTDKRVRQAIDLALDRQRFATTIMLGLTQPTYTMWIRRSAVWDASIDVGEFNLDKARSLLAEAGYPNGFATTIQASSAQPENVLFDQVIQSDLAKIGVNLSIEALDVNVWNTLVTQGKFAALANHIYAYGDQDPAMQFTAFVFRPQGNDSRFQSDEYSRLVDAASRATDWSARLGLYRQLGAFVKDAAFVLPIANSVYPWGLRENVHSFQDRTGNAGYPILEDIWLS
jgi:ABC-type transport system substrate-binding protein